MSALALFLALVLAVSAAHKLVARARLAAAAARLVGVSPTLGTPLLLAVAASEAMAAFAIVVAPLRTGGAIAAASIWCAYGLALLVRRGEVLDCGCDLSARKKPVGAISILRPFLLAALAMPVIVTTPSAWPVDAPFAAAALLALWFAASELFAFPSHTRIRA